jgi:hypothetical protein
LDPKQKAQEQTFDQWLKTRSTAAETVEEGFDIGRQLLGHGQYLVGPCAMINAGAAEA